jgi:hypothetical protein
MLLVDYWSFVVILANIMHIAGMSIAIFPTDSLDIKEQDFLVGGGTALIWCSLTKYLQHSKEMYALPATIIGSGRHIVMAFISVLPIFIGVAYFCVTIFGSFSWRFGSLRDAIA